jgi:hypothetical protein
MPNPSVAPAPVRGRPGAAIAALQQHRRGFVLCAVLLLGGCSDPPDLDPGTFRAQLSGALTGSLSGPSNASTVFIEPFPGPRFSIRMFAAQQGDTVRGLSVHCAGDAPPAPGTYEITAAGAQCAAGYVRLVSSLENGTTVLERAEASSGQLTISESGGGQVAGTFGWSGTLLVGSDPGGTLSASGSFSADAAP